MATIKVRYFTQRTGKQGGTRYFWQPNKKLRRAGYNLERLSDDRDQAIQEAQALNRDLDLARAGKADQPNRHGPNSINALIELFKKSRAYQKLAPRTKVDYDFYLALISTWAGDKPARAITAKIVADLYEAHCDINPRKAAYLIQVLRRLFNFGELEGFIPKKSNPASRPKLTYSAARGHIWTPQEVDHFVATADAMGLFAIGTAVMLNEWIGQRPADLIGIATANYRNGCIYIQQNKTGMEVFLPVYMVPKLKTRLDEQLARNARPHGGLFQQANGQPYGKRWFGRHFDRARAEAAKAMPSIAGLHLQKLRHTAITRLAEAGAELPLIASISGHSLKFCAEIIDRYNIRTTQMAREAFSCRLEAEAKHSAAESNSPTMPEPPAQ